MKKYFVEYTEGRNELVVSSSPIMVMMVSFNAGKVISRNTGYSKKKNALAAIERVNKAAGSEIAKYAGAYEV